MMSFIKSGYNAAASPTMKKVPGTSLLESIERISCIFPPSYQSSNVSATNLLVVSTLEISCEAADIVGTENVNVNVNNETSKIIIIAFRDLNLSLNILFDSFFYDQTGTKRKILTTAFCA